MPLRKEHLLARSEQGNTLLHKYTYVREKQQSLSPLLAGARILLTQDELATFINHQNNDGETALWLACHGGVKPSVVTTLLAENIDVNRPKADGTTPLMATCKLKTDPNISLAIAKQLINRADIDLNINDAKGGTALSTAFKYKNYRIATYLLAQPAINPFLDGHHGALSLFFACKTGNLTLVTRILDGSTQHLIAPIDVNRTDADGTTPLMATCRLEIGAINIPLAIAKQLTKYPNIDLNAQDKEDNTALLTAFECNNYDLATYLLTQPAINPFLDGHDGALSLFYACKIGNLALVTRILNGLEQHLIAHVEPTQVAGDAQAIFNSQHNYFDEEAQQDRNLTALHVACLMGHANIAAALMGHPQDFNRRDYDGSTALRFAIARGLVNIVATLVANETVNVNRSRITGESPLLLAIERRHEVIIGLLLARADVDTTLARRGYTPLSAAIFQDLPLPLCQKLIRRGQEAINQVDELTQRTALDYAVLVANANLVNGTIQAQDQTLIEDLLRHGAIRKQTTPADPFDFAPIRHLMSSFVEPLISASTSTIAPPPQAVPACSWDSAYELPRSAKRERQPFSPSQPLSSPGLNTRSRTKAANASSNYASSSSAVPLFKKRDPTPVLQAPDAENRTAPTKRLRRN